jgi:hypothetical protein
MTGESFESLTGNTWKHLQGTWQEKTDEADWVRENRKSANSVRAMQFKPITNAVRERQSLFDSSPKTNVYVGVDSTPIQKATIKKANEQAKDMFNSILDANGQ